MLSSRAMFFIRRSTSRMLSECKATRLNCVQSVCTWEITDEREATYRVTWIITRTGRKPIVENVGGWNDKPE